jgi:outer membrane immunogenic protein
VRVDPIDQLLLITDLGVPDMISRFLLGAVSLAALSTASLAADLPSRRAPPIYIPPAIPVFTWTGFYIGGNAGYAFNGSSTSTIVANDAFATTVQNLGQAPGVIGSNPKGFTGGGQIGYNYQVGGFSLLGPTTGLLVGVEADAAYINDRSNTLFTGALGIPTTSSSRLDFLGTARGRIGVTFDQFLVYGTGGFAYGGARGSTSIVGPAGGYAGGYDTIRTGYTYGGGVEYALPTTSFLNFFNSSAVTIKAEYLHYDLGTKSYDIAGNGVATGSSYSVRSHLKGDLVRAGLNFKFGSLVPAPVVARY